MSLRSILSKVDITPLLDDLDTLLSGTYWVGGVMMDGSEKDLMVVTYPWYTDFYTLDGVVSLVNMQAGDTVVIKEYIAIYANGAPTYQLYGSHTYSDAQAEPLIRFTQKPVWYAWKVTAQQTSGTYKNIPCGYIVRRTS